MHVWVHVAFVCWCVECVCVAMCVVMCVVMCVARKLQHQFSMSCACLQVSVDS